MKGKVLNRKIEKQSCSRAGRESNKITVQTIMFTSISARDFVIKRTTAYLEIQTSQNVCPLKYYCTTMYLCLFVKMVAYVFTCNAMSDISDQNTHCGICQRCKTEVCMSGEYSDRQLAKMTKKKYKNNITQSTCQKNANIKQKYSATSSSLQVT